MFATLRQSLVGYDTILDSSTHKGGLYLVLLVLVPFEKISALMKMRNPWQRLAGTSSFINIRSELRYSQGIILGQK